MDSNEFNKPFNEAQEEYKKKKKAPLNIKLADRNKKRRELLDAELDQIRDLIIDPVALHFLNNFKISCTAICCSTPI